MGSPRLLLAWERWRLDVLNTRCELTTRFDDAFGYARQLHQHQVRKGTAPHALAVLNSFVLALFDCCGVTNARQFMRCLDAQPLLAAQLLLKSLAEK